MQIAVISLLKKYRVSRRAVAEAERKFRIAASLKTQPTAIWCRRPKGVTLDVLIYVTIAGFVKKFHMFPTAIYVSQKSIRDLSLFRTDYYIRYYEGVLVIPYEIATVESVGYVLNYDVVLCLG